MTRCYGYLEFGQRTIAEMKIPLVTLYFGDGHTSDEYLLSPEFDTNRLRSTLSKTGSEYLETEGRYRITRKSLWHSIRRQLKNRANLYETVINR